MTPRITISDELAKQLEAIKERSYQLRGRGLEDVIAHIVDAYRTNGAVDALLQKHHREVVELLKGEVSKGVEDALKRWVSNILSLGRP